MENTFSYFVIIFWKYKKWKLPLIINDIFFNYLSNWISVENVFISDIHRVLNLRLSPPSHTTANNHLKIKYKFSIYSFIHAAHSEHTQSNVLCTQTHNNSSIQWIHKIQCGFINLLAGLARDNLCTLLLLLQSFQHMHTTMLHIFSYAFVCRSVCVCVLVYICVKRKHNIIGPQSSFKGQTGGDTLITSCDMSAEKIY